MDELTLVLVWRGLATVASKTYDQVEDILIVQEAVEEKPRSLEYYQQLLANRKEKAKPAPAPVKKEKIDADVPPAEDAAVAAEDLLPVCRGMAEDMLSCERSVMRAYKRVIDEGFAQNFGEGRAIETRANRAHAGSIKAEDIAERRRQVQARGRTQSG